MFQSDRSRSKSKLHHMIIYQYGVNSDNNLEYQIGKKRKKKPNLTMLNYVLSVDLHQNLTGSSPGPHLSTKFGQNGFITLKQSWNDDEREFCCIQISCRLGSQLKSDGRYAVLWVTRTRWGPVGDTVWDTSLQIDGPQSLLWKVISVMFTTTAVRLNSRTFLYEKWKVSQNVNTRVIRSITSEVCIFE